ncbi:MAG: proton-conducting transporter membrane subunit [Acidaminococcaceae bacterium]
MALFIFAMLCYTLGIGSIFVPRKHQDFAHYFAQLMSMLGSGAILLLAGGYLYGGQVQPVTCAKGGPYLLTMDGWSAVFLVITGLAGILTGIYGWAYALGYLGKRLRVLGALVNFFLLSMVLVLVAQEVIAFLFAWEIMAVVSFLLVNQESEKKQTWQAAYQYLVMTQLGTAAIMLAFLLVGSGAASMSFSDLATSALTDTMRNLAFVSAFVGFALKAGLVPLHVWLPQAHPAAPSHVSALMSGVMLKIAVYGFGRFIFSFLGPVALWWGVLVLIVGLLSAFCGALYAQMDKDIKRILAYSSVENMGLIFTGFGVGMVLLASAKPELAAVGFIAAVVHSFNHSIMKTLLFMAAGAMLEAVGDKNLEKMGGLGKKMPLTAGFTLVGCMGLAALPLTNGFVGEWLLLQSGVILAGAGGAGLRLLAILTLGLLGLTGALALGCFVRFFGISFLGRARSKQAAAAHEAPQAMLVAMGLAAGLVLITGLGMKGVVATATQVVVTSLQGLQAGAGGNYAVQSAQQLEAYAPLMLGVLVALIGLLVWGLCYQRRLLQEQSVTWNCGTVSTAKQQYSATGFSKPVRRTFDFLLKPTRQVSYLEKSNKYFGREMLYHLQLPDRFAEIFYTPLEHRLVKSAAFLRRLQAGSVQLYVAYVMLAMVLVLMWGAW